MYKRLKAPLTVQIEITGACTHACQHCYNFWRESRGSQRNMGAALSVADAKSIVLELAEAEVFSITLSGGEPLLNLPATLACIETARARNMGVSVNSNLVLLTPKIAASLKEAGLRHIMTSVLGPSAEIHDKLTQRPGSFGELVRSIRVAQGAGISVSANMVVSQLNLQHLRETARVVKRLGVERFSATKAGCPGNCQDFSRLALSSEAVVAMLNDLCAVHAELGLDVDTLEPIPVCGMLGVERPELFISRKCCAGVATFTVGSDGSVRPCSHLDVSYGHFGDAGGLSQIWEQMRPWAQGAYLPLPCRDCSLFSMCGGGCRMEAKTRTGDAAALDPYAKIGEASALRPVLAQHRRPPAISPDTRFRTRTLRMRREEFGGVVGADNNARAFLDEVGYGVVSQMRPETVYEIGDARINWNSLDPVRFVRGLLARNIVTLQN